MSDKTKTTASDKPEAPPPPPRVVRHSGADGIAITISAAAAGGIHAFGDLKPGVEYVVAPEEAARLTSEARGTNRRFTAVSAADEQRIKEFLAAQAAAAKAAEEKAAAEKSAPKKAATGDKE